MSGSVIHYATPAIATAAAEIGSVAAQTEDNHQQSLNIVNANAEHFGGRGSAAFQDAINQVNHQYAQMQQTIHLAGRTLMTANDGMTQHDGMCAAQY
jgi:uncharacterized protein YukE